MRERERGSAREVRGVVIFLVVQDGTGRGSRERERVQWVVEERE
jgi:hypothetical protein